MTCRSRGPSRPSRERSRRRPGAIRASAVGGEDLATRLRRIGRIGSDKAAENGRVKLADFGLAAGELPDATGIVGTPAYIAPELFDASSAATVRHLRAAASRRTPISGRHRRGSAAPNLG